MRADAGKGAVVKGEFRHIQILAFTGDIEHADRKLSQPDGSAAFRIHQGTVGQVVGNGEFFPGKGGTDAAGDIHLTLSERFKETVAGGKQGGIVFLVRHIRHPGKEIDHADGMPHGRILFPDGQVCLQSGAVAAVFFHLEDIGLSAAVIHKIGGKFQVTFVAGCAIESDESKLDLLMSGPAPALAFLQPKNGVDVVRITAETIQQFPFAETFIARHGGFHQVSRTVKFVRP